MCLETDCFNVIEQFALLGQMTALRSSCHFSGGENVALFLLEIDPSLKENVRVHEPWLP